MALEANSTLLNVTKPNPLFSPECFPFITRTCFPQKYKLVDDTVNKHEHNTETMAQTYLCNFPNTLTKRFQILD